MAETEVSERVHHLPRSIQLFEIGKERLRGGEHGVDVGEQFCRVVLLDDDRVALLGKQPQRRGIVLMVSNHISNS